MESSRGLLLVLIATTLAIIHIVQARDQKGFISLDCGLPANEKSPYRETDTGLQFSSDATYIQSGKSGRVQANLETRLLKPYATVRYFPDGIRNCYNLPVQRGRNHLIRTWFMYGNYDGFAINPKFDLYLGPNRWATIDLEKQVNGTTEEIFHVPTSNSLQICLVKTGTTTPMISALEIRPMGSNSYITKSGSLNLFFRMYITESKGFLRYPEDDYDRQWIAYFDRQSLSVINLSGNNLNGSLPQALQRKGLKLSIEGNPRLFSDSCRKPYKKRIHVAVVALASFAAIVICVLILFLVFKKKRSTMIIDGLHLRSSTSMVNVTFANKNSQRFTYSEVIEMTNNFQRVLGKGGFGIVYHGTVNGYEQVAVKVLCQSSTQGDKQFKADVYSYIVDLLLRVHHTNLVSLVGYCYEGDHLALIYEFLPNGDLKQHLSGKVGRSIINWSIRLQIALEAALGLEYLHIGCTPPMVHRDVKTANILLDENFKAKLADFGLSRSFQAGCESQESTVIVGTPGYLDPEYNRSGRLSEKSDVYSFGIVLLEMITTQPVINQTSKYSHISQWVGFKLNRGDLIEIMDPNLCNDYDSNSAWRALELAISCADPSSSKRPSMSQVIHDLKECIMCENLRVSNNQALKSQELNINFDSLNSVPMAR